MSTMLEQAIVDAKALKEAAVKSAEQAIIEKYAPEVKQAVESLLEQGPPPGMPMDPMGMPPGDPAMMGGMPMDPMGAPPPAPGAGADPAAAMGSLVPPPLAASQGETLCPCPDDNEPVQLDLAQLAAAVNGEAAMQDAAMGMAPGMPPAPGGMGMAPPPMPAAGMSPMAPGGGMGMPPAMMAENKVIALTEEALQEIIDETEDLDIDEAMLNSIAEEIMSGLKEEANFETRVNLSSPSTGMGGNTTPVGVHQEADDIVAAELALAEKNESLRHDNANIREYAMMLQQKNEQITNMLQHLNERLYVVNLSNAKLLYTNRVLSDNSLNERQRTKIVETISKSGSPEEAKALYETLLSAVGTQASPVKSPKSLREAVSRDRSLQMPRRQKPSSPDAKAMDRMRMLAGIKK